MNQRCPVCNKSVEASSDEQSGRSDFLPFCSERCKFVDLGAWFDEEYKIACGLQPHGLKDDSEVELQPF